MLNNIRDRILSVELKRDEKEVKIGFLIIGLVLILILGYVMYLGFVLTKNKTLTDNKSLITTPLPVINSSNSPSIFPSPTPSQATSINPKILTNIVKDNYINLGSGSNQSTDWTNVSGALSTFDIAQYQNIKEVHLETNIDVPTANGAISVRLFNKTDNYGVWNSERTVQSQAKGDLLISPNIIYDVGPKLYQVQMKSQLGVPANLIQSRIHVITK